MEKLKEFLDKLKMEYFENFDSYKISTIKLGEKINLIIFPHTVNDLKKLLKYLNLHKIYFRIFGNLSNVLIIENISYPVIVTNKMESEIQQNGNIVSVSAGTQVYKFYDYLKKNQLSGFEKLSNIPATIGGAIFNNAGAYNSSISKNLLSIEVFKDGKIITISKNDIKFCYHYSSLMGFIILKATFLFENKKECDIINMTNEFTLKRNKSQPTGFSLGSVFKKVKNTSAGFYIERAGLKGLKVGGVFVSNKHANFFINDGFGTVLDFLRLENIVKSKVLEQFGITLFTEIEKVGNKDEIVSRFTHPFKF